MTSLSSSSVVFASEWLHSESYPRIDASTFDQELVSETIQPREHFSWDRPHGHSQYPKLNRLEREISQGHSPVNRFGVYQTLLAGESRPSPSAAVIDSVASNIRRYIANEPSTTLTESHYRAGLIDLLSMRDPANAVRRWIGWEAFFAYGRRIEILRRDGELDGITVNKESLQDFWSFVESTPFAAKAELVLVDNGNLRAVWDGGDGSHLGFQFLGDHMVQYVIFRRRQGSGHVSRVAGRDTLEGVKQQVRNFDLEVLLKT